jgi:asparagine synthase (glutamine-hydrolysing)
MCGIAGIARRRPTGVALETLARMAGAIRHRGPDGYGFYTSDRVGFGHVRLSIVDVAGGAQPMTNEDGRVTIVYNGEVYNHADLRRELAALGHVFRSRCDTEVLIHGYEEWGAGLLSRLNGQFAFAIHDANSDTVFLARDRFGVRPLFYARSHGDLYFASEIKALLATREVPAAIDPAAIDEVFSFWAVRPPRTGFADIFSLEPGTFARWRAGDLSIGRYYEIDYAEADAEPRDAVERLDEIMRSGVGMRLRADVPVGAYLSGGLDSSITSVLAANASPHTLRTFSIAFDDPRYDESTHQRAVADAIGSMHAVASARLNSVAESFPAVIRHTETPLLRTAAAPMYQLARLVRESGIKVVLTGEGADELFLGYDLFKEVSVRRFCLRRPESAWRPRLFDRLYPYQAQQTRSGEFWRKFFLESGSTADPLFSHLPRFSFGAWFRDLYASEFRNAVNGVDTVGELRAALPERFFGWSPLNQAAYLEMTTLLSPYLLSSQGDRMAMAHGVEGRYPFLDHRLFEFSAALPTSSRLLGLKEKEVLRRWATRILPPPLAGRTKQPYRAPDAPSFFGPNAPRWVDDALSPAAIARAGVFAPRAVEGLMKRCREGRVTRVRENQAVVGILSVQLWYEQFIDQPFDCPMLDPQSADVLLADAVPTHP